MDAVQALIGEFFDHDVKIGDEKTRKGLKAVVAKGRGKSAIGAKLIVLIDSESASGAEVFARTIQLEKRGIVLGDRSSGRVMKGERFVHTVEVKDWYLAQYGASITVADLIMPDGMRLENVGVTPDEIILPSAPDLAAGLDPVLAQAASLAGVEMSSQKAGSLFPFKWPDKPLEIH